MKKFFKFYRTNFISLLFIAIFFASQLQPAFSGEFSSAVESSRSETEAQEEEKTVSTSSSESEDNSLIVFLAKIAGVFWYYNNFTVRYTSFPYKYENLTYMKWAETETNPEAKTKSNRYSASDSFFYLADLGTGNEFCFEGLFFPIIGPYFENLVISEQDNFFDETYGNIRLGAQLSILQSNLITITGIVQWSRWYGNISEVLKSSGLALGMDFRFYPLKPLGFQWKFCWQEFDENVYLRDSLLSAGIFLHRYEIFVGWKLLEVGNSENLKPTKTWNGISAGCRVYF